MPNKFDSNRDIPGLDSKVVLVTGGNAGIGSVVVRALAAHTRNASISALAEYQMAKKSPDPSAGSIQMSISRR